MKKTLLILSIITIFFAGCKKDVEPVASKLEMTNETIERGWDYVKITVEYEYPVELKSIVLYLSENEDMSGARTYSCKIEGKTFSVEVDGLEKGRDYYCYFEFDDGYNKVKGEKYDVMTIVVTKDVTNKTTTSATLNGSVTNDADNKIVARGFCWSMEPNVTIEDESINNGGSSGAGTSTFSHNLTNLKDNTTYYYKAYATTELGVCYGEEKSFKTVEVTLPIVTTKEVKNITTNTASCGGNVTGDGNGIVTARGICWSEVQNPTINNIYSEETNNGTGTGSFTSQLTNLKENTTYYVRAYAVNEKGVAYGEEKSFKTVEVTLPTVTTKNVTNITANTASCGGNVNSDGNGTVTARGICWSEVQNPTINNIYSEETNNGTGTGSFTSQLTNLKENTTYYVRAYAVNEKGVAYGEEKSFKTEEIVDIDIDISVDSDGNEIVTLYGNIVFKMISVEGGTFSMGATSEQGGDADSGEKPVHSVTLSDYYIGETEVTQELWQAVMGNNPSYSSGSQKPVEQVSWNDCREFITKLNQLTGKNFRLPTEAEWEYAARGGNKSQGYKYSGSNTIGNVAWYIDNSSSTHDVKTKSPNELGIYDMSGNVWEWCRDWYGSYSSGSQTNPAGSSSGFGRVLRGGGWGNGASYCRVSFRYYSSPGNRGSSCGFRVVCLP